MTDTRGRCASAMLASIGALAFTIACVTHEAIGHSTACLVSGHQILLLTSVYFRCANATWMTDLAGPLANGLAALLCGWMLRRQYRWTPPTRLLIVFSMAFNGCWLAGCAIHAALLERGDLAFVLSGMAPPGSIVPRVVMAAAGLLAYLGVVRFTMTRLSSETPVVAACLGALAVAGIASACFAGAVGPSLREGMLEGVGATIGLLIASRRIASRSTTPGGFEMACSLRWMIASVLLALAFVLVLGHGLGDPARV